MFSFQFKNKVYPCEPWSLFNLGLGLDDIFIYKWRLSDVSTHLRILGAQGDISSCIFLGKAWTSDGARLVMVFENEIWHFDVSEAPGINAVYKNTEPLKGFIHEYPNFDSFVFVYNSAIAMDRSAIDVLIKKTPATGVPESPMKIELIMAGSESISYSQMENMTLDTFGGLLKTYEDAGKSLIIARVVTSQMKNDDKTTFVHYYEAHSLNQYVLCAQTIGNSHGILYRPDVRNPANNVPMITPGGISYFIVKDGKGFFCGTVNDYKESRAVRHLFKKNALEKRDAYLFSLDRKELYDIYASYSE
jgi:hypothetical protein